MLVPAKFQHGMELGQLVSSMVLSLLLLYLLGAHKRAREELFTEACSGMTRGNCSKLTEDGFRIDNVKKNSLL